MTDDQKRNTALRSPVRNASLSRQTQEILVDRIRGGVYPPRSQLPPENDLAVEFKVSRPTIRSAMSALAERGLVFRRHGIGTFVSQRAHVSNPLNETEDFSYMIRKSGAEPSVQYVNVALVPPPRNLAERLKVHSGDSVLQSQKIFFADGQPVIYCINSIPIGVLGDELAEEAVAKPEIIEPLFDLLEKRCNQRTDYTVAKLQADIAKNCLFPRIPLRPSTPLLIIDEVAYNPNELPLWHSLAYFPSSHMTFELIRHRAHR